MSNALSLALQLTATGVSSVQSGFAQVGRAVNGVTDEISNARRRTKELEEEIKRARDAGDIQALTTASAQLANHLQSAGVQAGRTQERLAGLRETGAKMAAAGGAGLLLAQSFIEADKEGAATEARLESIFKAQKRLGELPQAKAAIQRVIEEGHFDAEGALDVEKSGALMASMRVSTKDMEAALPRLAALARSAGEESSEAFVDSWSDGYNLLELAPLESAKIYFSKSENEDFEKYKEEAGEAAARIRFMEMVIKRADETAGSLGDSLSEAQQRANDMGREASRAAQNVGKGCAEAKKFADGLTGSLLAAANTSPELQKGAGVALYMGSALLTAGGSALSLASQIGLLRIGFPGLWTAAAPVITSLTTGFGGLAVAVGSVLIPLALVAASIAALWVAWKGSQDAGSLSDEKLKEKWGPLGDFWVSASGSDRDSGPTQEDRDAYEMAKRSGLTKKSFEEWRGSSIDNTPTPKVDPVEKAKADVAKAQADAAAAMQKAVSASPAASSATASPASTSGAAPSAEAASKAAQGERDKLAKKLEDERKKALDAEKKLAQGYIDNDDEVRKAQIEELYATKIAELEARAGKDEAAKTNYARAMLEAEKVEALGNVLDGNETEVAGERRIRLAAIRAEGMRSRAALAYKKDLRSEAESKKDTASSDLTASDGLAWVRNGGNILDLDRAAKAGGVASSGKGAPAGPQEVSVPIRSRTETDESGGVLVRFVADPIRLPNPLGAAMRPR